MSASTKKLKQAAPIPQPQTTGARFTILADELQQLLNLLSRILPKKPTHSVLANFLVEVDATSGNITFTATDIAIALRKTIVALTVERSGSFTVSGKLLSDLVVRLSGAELTVEADDMGRRIQVSATNSRYEFQGVDKSEFPELSPVDSSSLFEIDAKALQAGIKFALVAVAEDVSRQILTGAHLHLWENGWKMAATDGLRLSVYAFSRGALKREIGALTIPSQALSYLKAIARSGETVGLRAEFSLSPDRAYSSQPIAWESTDGRWQLSSRVLQGKYPDYKKLFPTQFVRQITVSRKQLLSSLDRVRLFADDKNVVRLSGSFREQMLTLTTGRDECSSVESLDARIEPCQSSSDEREIEVTDRFEIGFNLELLSQALQALGADDVEISLGTSLSPAVLCPILQSDVEGEEEIEQSYRTLLMPIQLR